MDRDTAAQIADRLLAAYDARAFVPLISDGRPGFGMADAYAVLDAIEDRRRAMGWERVGRKLGFTNTTLWEAMGVDRAFWAPVWRETQASGPVVSIQHLVQTRIEPEVVFKVTGPPDPADVLAAVEWVAPGFEIVQCLYEGWKLTVADCCASFGFHGALVIGDPLPVDRLDPAAYATFTLTLSKDGEEVARGTGANVLGSPALALRHLVEVLAEQGRPPLQAGEVVTTGTITDAQYVNPGETWSSDYGTLGLPGLTVTLS